MKNFLFIYLFITLSIIVNSCTEGFKEEYSKLVIALTEVTAITTPTTDTTPDYTFSSTGSGAITYGGSCSSSTTIATTGNNTITLNTLSVGTYADCTITVSKTISTKKSVTNLSDSLTITSFTVSSTLSAPDNLSASGANNTITLTWNSVSGATSYTLYWDNVSGIDSSDTAITSITNDNYTHNNMDNGSTYYYKVAAVNSSGTGTLSSVASALLSANIQGSETYNAHTYAMTSAAMTFAEAKAAAAALGGYLTTVNTKAENTFLTNEFYAAYGNKALWIGANDIATEATWVWDNGTTSGDDNLTDTICNAPSGDCRPSLAQWADGTYKWCRNAESDCGANEPNNAGNAPIGEDCANITNSSGFWNDLKCSRDQYGIIEFD